MCLYPINIKVEGYHHPVFYRPTSCIAVPCGKCVECLKDRQNSWKLRLVSEAGDWPHLYFFTLTYSDQTVSRNDKGNTTASKSHIQNWIKRFRINTERNNPNLSKNCKWMKYFICAEYAPEGEYISRKGVRRKSTCRPHYHGLIFTLLDKTHISPLFADWRNRYGFVQLSEVACTSRNIRGERSAVANYVSKYCCKGEFASRAKEIELGEIEKAFTLCSKGIGYNYVEKYKSYHLCGFPNDGINANPYNSPSDEQINQILSRRYVMDGAFRYKMPRYYADRIYRHLVEKPQCKFYFDDSGVLQCEIIYVRRFSSSSVLCAKMSKLLQDRVLERGRREIEFYQNIIGQDCPSDYGTSQVASLLSKESRLRTKLSNFYSFNATKWSSLAVDD